MNLPRFRPQSLHWIAPALALVVGGSMLATHASASPQLIRNFLFIGGPLVLFSGLHDRTYPFLHAEERFLLLHNPIATRDHWSQALRSHFQQIAIVAVAGIIAIVTSQCFGSHSSPLFQQATRGLIYSCEWLWLCLFVGLLEPIGSAFAAMAGRRHPGTNWVSDLQQTLNNGWTTAEATIHLYAPACTLAAATLCALPGQLTIAHFFTSSDPQPRFVLISLAPVVIAFSLRFVWAPQSYARHTWHAVPWLEEARKSLGGLDEAIALPFWVRSIRSSTLRILTIQLFRLTPVLHLRLLSLLGFSTWTAVISESLGMLNISITAVLIAWWILPIRKVIGQLPQLNRLGMPLPIRVREYVYALWGVILIPPLLSLTIIICRFVLS